MSIRRVPASLRQRGYIAPPMDRPDQRLKAVRISAGFKSAAKFVKHLNDKHLDAEISEATYRSHEAAPGQKNHRGFGEKEARLYAPELGVTWSWLLTGEGEAHPAKPEKINRALLNEALLNVVVASKDFGNASDEQIQDLADAVARAYERYKARSEKKTA